MLCKVSNSQYKTFNYLREVSEKALKIAKTYTQIKKLANTLLWQYFLYYFPI